MRAGAVAVWALALAGCPVPVGNSDGNGNGDDDDNVEAPPPLRLEREKSTQTSNGSGRMKVEVEVPEGAVSFQVTGTSSLFVSFEEVVDPQGRSALDWTDWVYSDESITLSFYPLRNTTALNWPIRGKDGPLTPGTWTVWMATTNSSYQYVPDVKVDLTTELKFDPEPNEGHYSVQIVWADGVDDDQKVVNAVEAATERWAEVWAKSGLTLDVHYATSKLDPDLSFTYSGDPAVEKVADKKADGELQLIVGETVFGEDYIFGVSAGIPGTIEPTEHTFVVLSWLTHAGVDGKFDDDEIRLMGETMAHECGHYTGLFHPVEATYNAWDALADTDKCTRGSTCDDVLGSNVMYPYPLCTFVSCDPQGQMTEDQGEVMNNYVGAL
ncbi:MAG: hypothetical protein ABMA64_18655 [Myxococcota bacterium]